ncbi:hypothetical protein CPT_Scapp_013 [Serratia phage Scapp]|uniref:Uncharacterized protein n=1 Tax=Serratia phage Scapp TaxID=2282409 RepID=A0A345L6P0_9CAUD|nr:hypothetical protein PP898_gp13 [Serratia phage Scapp]AXH50942.1 hypothetical protein CPT_Scapp_013 [Serratia phage Scapp]
MAKSKWGRGLDEVRADEIKVGDVVMRVVDAPVFEVTRIKTIARTGQLRIWGDDDSFTIWPHSYMWRYKNWNAKHTHDERLAQLSAEKRRLGRLLRKASPTGRSPRGCS